MRICLQKFPSPQQHAGGQSNGRGGKPRPQPSPRQVEWRRRVSPVGHCQGGPAARHQLRQLHMTSVHGQPRGVPQGRFLFLLMSPLYFGCPFKYIPLFYYGPLSNDMQNYQQLSICEKKSQINHRLGINPFHPVPDAADRGLRRRGRLRHRLHLGGASHRRLGHRGKRLPGLQPQVSRMGSCGRNLCVTE